MHPDGWWWWFGNTSNTPTNTSKHQQGQFLDRIFDAGAKFGIVVLLDLHVLSVEKGIQVGPSF